MLGLIKYPVESAIKERDEDEESWENNEQEVIFEDIDIEKRAYDLLEKILEEQFPYQKNDFFIDSSYKCGIDDNQITLVFYGYIHPNIHTNLLKGQPKTCYLVMFNYYGYEDNTSLFYYPNDELNNIKKIVYEGIKDENKIEVQVEEFPPISKSKYKSKAYSFNNWIVTYDFIYGSNTLFFDALKRSKFFNAGEFDSNMIVEMEYSQNKKTEIKTISTVYDKILTKKNKNECHLIAITIRDFLDSKPKSSNPVFEVKRNFGKQKIYDNNTYNNMYADAANIVEEIANNFVIGEKRIVDVADGKMVVNRIS